MLLKKLKELKEEGSVVGFTASTFDLLHPGHALMLEECKLQCDFLIVGLLTDPTISRPLSKNKPLQSTLERWLQAQSLNHIDLLIPFDTEEDLYNLVAIIMPNVRFVGEEYDGVEFTGKELEGSGVRTIYNKRRHSYSSTKLRNKLRE
tara:strand:+ start:9991 stop:10434 length:444 start_codon:yes stop_codon:yes gene_type:complete